MKMTSGWSGVQSATRRPGWDSGALDKRVQSKSDNDNGHHFLIRNNIICIPRARSPKSQVKQPVPRDRKPTTILQFPFISQYVKPSPNFQSLLALPPITATSTYKTPADAEEEETVRTDRHTGQMREESHGRAPPTNPRPRGIPS